MRLDDDFNAILKRIEDRQETEADRAALLQILRVGSLQEVSQKFAKYNIHIQKLEGDKIQIGDIIYNGLTEQTIKALLQAIRSQIAELLQVQLPKTDLNFEAYLRSLTQEYQQWWKKYTLTDALSREKRKGEENGRSAFEWNFNLMVQTAPKPKAERQREEQAKVEQQREEQSKVEQQREEQSKVERFPVLEGIRKYAKDHVLLVGRPGSGKSTALFRLMLEEAKSQDSIPVLVELRFWQTSILDRILAFFHKHDPKLDLNEATVNALLRQGRLLLLIDGLNELLSEESRRDVTRFRKDYGKSTPMISTTRELSVGGDLGIEKKLEMQPLTEAQMRTFVKAYLPEQGEALLRQLKDRLREFGQVPLLLWMLCGLFKQTGVIPPNLGMVFRQFTQKYECNLKEDAPVSEQSRSNWSELLQRLAFVMMHENSQLSSTVEFRVAIARSQVLQIFEEWLQNRVMAPRDRAVECLNDLLEHHLIQLNGDQVEFRHQLLQEYYAAEYLLRLLPRLSDAELKRDYLNYLKWTEPIALMLTLVEDEAQALRVVRLALNDVDLRLGARLAGEVSPKLQKTTVAWIDALEIPLLLKCECWAISRSEQAISRVLKAFDDPDDDPNGDVRSRAAEALGKIGSEQAVDRLLTALDDPNDNVRWGAAEVLGEIGSEQAVDRLLTALDDPNDNVRSRAAEALGKIGSEQAVTELLKALDDSGGDVRSRATEALGKIGSKQAVTGLLKALGDLNDNVRSSAATALGKIGSEQAVIGLLKALDDPDSDVRWSATEALGKIGGKQAVTGLLKALGDLNDNVRSRAAEALGKIGGDQVSELLKTLANPHHDICGNAANAPCEIVGEQAVTELLKAFANPNHKFRSSVATALGEIGGGQAVTGLLKMLDDPDRWVRWRSAEALGKIGGGQTIAALWQAQIKHSTESEMGEAIAAIQSRCKFYNYDLLQE
jgi:HEAT repeat protein